MSKYEKKDSHIIWAKDLDKHFSKEKIQMDNIYENMFNVTNH